MQRKVNVPRYGCRDKGAKKQHLVTEYFFTKEFLRVNYNYNNDLAVDMK